MVFSANLQETLGISCYEGALAGALPMVPDRLSYSEMYMDDFKYPSEWTKSWTSYKKHKQLLVNEIKIWMSRYDEIIKSKKLNELTTFLISLEKSPHIERTADLAAWTEPASTRSATASASARSNFPFKNARSLNSPGRAILAPNSTQRWINRS